MMAVLFGMLSGSLRACDAEGSLADDRIIGALKVRVIDGVGAAVEGRATASRTRISYGGIGRH